MSPYILVPLLVLTALLPMVFAWGVAHTYRVTKIVLWSLWAVTVSVGVGLWYYALDGTQVMHGNEWIAMLAIVWNVILFFDAIDSPFEPKQPRKSKAKVQDLSERISAARDNALIRSRTGKPASKHGIDLSKEQSDD